MFSDQKKSSSPKTGPVVKTGPTRGKERSRNDDGSWRKKRSDSGQPREKKSGCFLTTAACRFKELPDDCYELSVLRKFRDEKLMATADGAQMVENYYQIAPGIAQELVCKHDLEYVWNTVLECVRCIEQGHDDHAVKAYSEMVFRLQQKSKSVS